MALRKPYETKLTPKEELAFKFWRATNARIADGPNAGKIDSGADYDQRGAFKEYGSSYKEKFPGHGPDKYKKPNHPTFSNQSQYSSPEHPGGHWEGDKFVAASISDSIAPTIEPKQSPARRKRTKTEGLSEAALSADRIPNRPRTPKKMEKPSAALERRMKSEREERTIGEALAEAAAMLPPGEGPAGRFLKSTVSGAAAGATVGQFLGDAMERRRQAGTRKKKAARTVSEKSYES